MVRGVWCENGNISSFVFEFEMKFFESKDYDRKDFVNYIKEFGIYFIGYGGLLKNLKQGSE